jgi:hypothetical protein
LWSVDRNTDFSFVPRKLHHRKSIATYYFYRLRALAPSLRQHYAPSADFNLSAGASHEQLHNIIEENIDVGLLSEFAVAMADSMSDDSLDSDVPNEASNETKLDQQKMHVSPACSKTVVGPSTQTSQVSKLNSSGYNDTEPWDSNDDEPSITRASCSTSKPYDLSPEAVDVVASGNQTDADCRSDDDVTSDPSVPRRRSSTERDNSCFRRGRRRIVRNRQKSGLTSSARAQLGTVYRLPKLSNAIEASSCLDNHVQLSKSDDAETVVDKALLAPGECATVNVTNTQTEGLTDNSTMPTTEYAFDEVNGHCPCKAVAGCIENGNDVPEIASNDTSIKLAHELTDAADSASDYGTSPPPVAAGDADFGIDSTMLATECNDFIRRLLIDPSADEISKDDDVDPELGKLNSSSAIQNVGLQELDVAIRTSHRPRHGQWRDAAAFKRLHYFPSK